MTAHNGWQLLFHNCLISQLHNLEKACNKAKDQHPTDFEKNANIKLFNVVSKLIFQVIPDNPNHESYGQGNTIGSEYRHWRRAKIGRRFRLFFRFDSKSKIIIFAWLNDDNTLRAAGSKNDPYVIFKNMLERGYPPNNWSDLLLNSHLNWQQP